MLIYWRVIHFMCLWRSMESMSMKHMKSLKLGYAGLFPASHSCTFLYMSSNFLQLLDESWGYSSCHAVTWSSTRVIFFGPVSELCVAPCRTVKKLNVEKKHGKSMEFNMISWCLHVGSFFGMFETMVNNMGGTVATHC